jgi:hypothetical protein
VCDALRTLALTLTWLSDHIFKLQSIGNQLTALEALKQDSRSNQIKQLETKIISKNSESTLSVSLRINSCPRACIDVGQIAAGKPVSD